MAATMTQLVTKAFDGQILFVIESTEAKGTLVDMRGTLVRGH